MTLESLWTVLTASGWLLAVTAIAGVVGCGSDSGGSSSEGKTPPAARQAAAGTPAKPSSETDAEWSIATVAFGEGEPIPKRFTEDGEDVSPPLAWSGVPQGSKQLALICDDPDAPTPQPWVHWVIYGISPETTGLPEGVAQVERPDTVAGAMQGKNSWPKDNLGYRGPAPPPAHGVHRYYFKLYALDTALTLQPGLTKDELLAAMKGHVLAEVQLMGTYDR